MEDLFDMVPEEEVQEETNPKAKEKKEKKEKKENKENKEVKKYTYPFIMHIAARNIDISHVFEEGKEYSEDEITKAMLEHQFYDFAGSVSYDFIESDNVLIPIFKQHKKG